MYSKISMDKICIYNYLDYRAYLADLFLFVKGKNPQFSYRVFARKAGFSSPNFLKLVIQGVRNLTKDSIARFAKAFSLDQEEGEFFENLVLMNQAITHDEKNFYYHKLSKTKGYLKIKKIEKDYFEYLSTWYHPAIREIIAFKKGKITPAEIALMLCPSVNLEQVNNSLELLVQLGLISKNKDQTFKQEFPHLSTGPEVESIMVRNYHREAMKLAGQSLDNFAHTYRDISAVVIPVKKEQIKELKAKVNDFRKELLAYYKEAEKADAVMQVNLQMFPLVKMED